MPSTFGLIDSTLANLLMGSCRIYRPTGVTNTPLQSVGMLENSKLSIKAKRVAFRSRLPDYELLAWNIGMEALISGSAKEPTATENLEMFTGATAAATGSWAGAVLFSPYTALAGTLVVTGDVSSSIAANDLCTITEAGVGTENFVAAKVTVSTNTTITLPLDDPLINSYTVAATVSRGGYSSTNFGKIEALSPGTGLLVFSPFLPQSGASYKAVVIKAWKMELPREMDLDLEPAPGQVLGVNVQFRLLADPTKVNGQQLGIVNVYTLTAP